MKKLLLLALLAGCTSKPAEEASHLAISAYLVKTADDPSSYQPVSWGGEKPYTKQEADHEKGQQKLRVAAARAQEALRYQDLVYKLSGNQSSEAIKQAAEWQKEADKNSLASDSASKLGKALQASSDTARPGIIITHTYRIKNKTAALVLDSAQFIVLKNGAVQRLDF